MTIQLLFFHGCPHVEAARAQLRAALGQLGLEDVWAEIDVQDPATPDDLRRYGSPTILVDGADVVPKAFAPAAAAQAAIDTAATDGAACRLYLGSDRPGAPPLTALLSALRVKSAGRAR